MNSYASLKQQNKRSLSAAVALALCVILSTVMLFSRLAYFVTPDTTHYIPLTTNRGGTRITVTQPDAPRTSQSLRPTVRSATDRGGARLTVTQLDSSRTSESLAPVVLSNTDLGGTWLTATQPDAPRTSKDLGPTVLAAGHFLGAAWFRTYDENTVWSGETDIEIFRMSYENAAGEITVQSAGADKVLAPGTENTYAFALENTGSENLKFDMSMEAFFSDGTHVIPVEVKVWGHDGTYFAGTADSYADVMALNQVSDSGALKPGYIMPYTLQWQWPFEVDDEYDTMLGNLAVDEDMSLTIVIRTTASYTPNADDGEPPKTGDTAELLLYSLLLIGSVSALFLLILYRPRREEENA